MSKWHSGPPPHAGFWLCRVGEIEAWRWYDRGWSWHISSDADPQKAQYLSSKPALADSWDIEWSDYWPENARVPRIDPRMK